MLELPLNQLSDKVTAQSRLLTLELKGFFILSIFKSRNYSYRAFYNFSEWSFDTRNGYIVPKMKFVYALTLSFYKNRHYQKKI